VHTDIAQLPPSTGYVLGLKVCHLNYKKMYVRIDPDQQNTQ
jgi:hypothetical protein